MIKIVMIVVLLLQYLDLLMTYFTMFLTKKNNHFCIEDEKTLLQRLIMSIDNAGVYSYMISGILTSYSVFFIMYFFNMDYLNFFLVGVFIIIPVYHYHNMLFEYRLFKSKELKKHYLIWFNKGISIMRKNKWM